MVQKFMKRLLPILVLLATAAAPARAANQQEHDGGPVPTPYIAQNDTLTFETMHSLQTKAAEGDVEAEFSLGFIYAQGNGVKKDYNEAIKWFKKAADAGDAAAQSDLGFIYAQGQGVKQD